MFKSRSMIIYQNNTPTPPPEPVFSTAGFLMRAGAALGVLILFLFMLWALSGCAIGHAEDGTAMIGVTFTGTTAAGAGRVAGQVLGAFGIPGAPQIGELIGYGIGALGIGGAGYGLHKSGEGKGWDQREAAATIQAPMQMRPPA